MKNRIIVQGQRKGKHARDKSQHAEASPHLPLPQENEKNEEKGKGKGKIDCARYPHRCKQCQQ